MSKMAGMICALRFPANNVQSEVTNAFKMAIANPALTVSHALFIRSLSGIARAVIFDYVKA